MQWLGPKLGRVAKQDQQMGKSELSSQLAAHVDGLVQQLAPKVVAPFAHLAGEIDKSNRKAMGTIGLDIRGQLGPHIDDFREWNQSLIKGAARDYLSDLQEVLDDPDTWGLRIEEIEALLAERGDVAASHAKLIARDQTQKLNAAVNQFRQRNAGVSEYEWSTSLDERVRDEHMSKEGQTFTWGSPPPDTGDPGDDVNCRCVAIPVIPDLDDEEEGDIAAAAET